MSQLPTKFGQLIFLSAVCLVQPYWKRTEPDTEMFRQSPPALINFPWIAENTCYIIQRVVKVTSAIHLQTLIILLELLRIPVILYRRSSKYLRHFSSCPCLCCMLTSDPAKHAIPKTAEVAYSIGQLWEEIA